MLPLFAARRVVSSPPGGAICHTVVEPPVLAGIAPCPIEPTRIHPNPPGVVNWHFDSPAGVDRERGPALDGYTAIGTARRGRVLLEADAAGQIRLEASGDWQVVQQARRCTQAVDRRVAVTDFTLDAEIRRQREGDRRADT